MARTGNDKNKADYQTLPTFEEYLLVNSRHRSVERYHRDPRGVWTYQRYASNDTITLDTIGMSCPVGTLYRGVRRAALIPLA